MSDEIDMGAIVGQLQEENERLRLRLWAMANRAPIAFDFGSLAEWSKANYLLIMAVCMVFSFVFVPVTQGVAALLKSHKEK